MTNNVRRFGATAPIGWQMILTGGAGPSCGCCCSLWYGAYATQIAQEGPGQNILRRVVSSILDAAVLRDGQLLIGLSLCVPVHAQAHRPTIRLDCFSAIVRGLALSLVCLSC